VVTGQSKPKRKQVRPYKKPNKKFSALQVIFWFEKQENILIRVFICGPKGRVWIAGFVPALEYSFKLRFAAKEPIIGV
jgi:hypothetical protein